MGEVGLAPAFGTGNKSRDPASCPVPMHLFRFRPLRFVFSNLSRAVVASVAVLLIAVSAIAQGGGGRPPGGGVIVPPGGGGVVVPPGGVITGPRIVTDTGILLGQSSVAAVVVPNTAGAGATPVTSTYQWTISGGRITTDPTRQTVNFTPDVTGTLSLNVVITTSGTSQSTSIDVTVLSPALAGTMTTVATVATNAVSLTASVPAAANGDRTFRWTVSGAGAGITAGQNTNTVTLRPGNPGVLEVMCDVNLQQLAVVTLRSFIVVTGQGAPTVITVDSGAGGGTYPAGSRVDIFANPPAAGQVFDRWTGDTAVLGAGAIAPSLTHTVMTVPTTPATLTATYRTVTTWTPTTVTGFNPIATGSPNGTTLTYYIPAAAQGVVFLLHDTGDAGPLWFNGAEQLTLARDLVAAGYGVASLSSANRTNGAWSQQAILANNLDAATHAAALDRFVSDGLLTATKPVFFLGLATGADAAARYADLLATATPARPVKGVVLYCATGGASLAVTSRVPHFFALATHDEAIGTTGNASALSNSQLLAGRGIATGIVSNAISPVHGDRFRILGVNSPSFTAADATAVWTAVKAASLIDANNYPKSVATVAEVRTALPATYQPRAAEVAAELAVAYAAQEFYSDANARVINFLNNRAADVPVPAPGRLINLSTRTKIAFLGDSFALGFNISGTQRATLLIRGIGPALAKFGLPGALPALRLEVNSGATVIASNDAWDKPAAGGATAAQIISAATSVGAFALAAGDPDTSVLLSLDPGSYTANIKGLNGATGDVLAEIYDVSRNGTRLTNLSTLAKISADGELLIPGIVIVGNSPRTLVVRAVAQGLADFGLPAASLLGDARISILTTGPNGASQTVGTNNNWAQAGAATLTAAFPAVGAFPLRAASDAALIEALAPGSYTLQAGAAPIANGPGGQPPAVVPNQTGSVLVEVYEVP